MVIFYFKTTKKPKIGNIKIYRPTGNLGNDLYKYSEQDYFKSEINYTGASVDTLKNLEIRNKGGMVGFRVSLEDLGNYTSNESVTYNGSLLSKIGVTNEDMKFSISFDLTITLDNNVIFGKENPNKEDLIVKGMEAIINYEYKISTIEWGLY